MQKQTFIDFYNKHEGKFFELKVQDRKIGSNYSSIEKGLTKAESESKISDLLQYANDGDKIELSVSNTASTNGASTLVKYNTLSGQRETKPNNLAFGGNESSYQSGFNQGYNIGYEAGKRESENKAILDKLASLEAGGGGGALEKLMSSPMGDAIASILIQKFVPNAPISE